MDDKLFHVFVVQVLFLWLLFCLVCFTPVYYNNWFTFGPQADLILFGVPIDTTFRYLIVVLYIFGDRVVAQITESVLLPHSMFQLDPITACQQTIDLPMNRLIWGQSFIQRAIYYTSIVLRAHAAMEQAGLCFILTVIEWLVFLLHPIIYKNCIN